MPNTTPNIITERITTRVESENDLVGIHHQPDQTLVRLFDFPKHPGNGGRRRPQTGFHRRAAGVRRKYF
jgi:hypothetical protein